MAQNLDPGYIHWVSERMWKNGFSLFADGTEPEIKDVARKMSVSKDILLGKAKYKGNEVHLLYVGALAFPLIPSEYFYQCADDTESGYLRLADTISMYRNGNTVGSWQVV